MPRLTAARRLAIMSAALAFGEDRSAAGQEYVSIADIADELNEDPEDVRESLEPLVWIELKTPEGIVDLLDAVRLEDDRLIVEEAWWRRLAVISPAEAARLYTKAAAAASLEPAESIHLSTAMAKLRRIVGEITVVEGDRPQNVEVLRRARDEGQPVVVNIEGRDRTVVTRGATFRVLSVYRSGNEWMTTLASMSQNEELDLSGGDAITVPVRRLLAVIPSLTDRPQPESGPSVFDFDEVVEVTVEYPIDRDWVLDPYSPTKIENSTERETRIASVNVWGTTELKTLMLRLGPEARVLAPENLQAVGSEAAREILDLYGS